MSRYRLDQLLVEKGFFESREKAKVAIKDGSIYVDNKLENKPSSMIEEEAVLEFRGEKMPYVSRGGYKLEKAIKVFNIDLNNKICVDIGASTGGFTDCMIQNGSKFVFSIDCGTNQLAYKLRQNDKVKVLEKTNARYIEKEIFDEMSIDFCSIDVSFISLTLILPKVYEILKDKGEVVALIKPQFEVGKEDIGNGVVKDKKLHLQTIKTIIQFSKELKFYINGIDYSPIKGPKGNIEYLLYMKKSNEVNEEVDCNETFLKDLVENSHNVLNE